MTMKTESQHLTQSAQLLLGALKNAGVDLSAEPGTPGKLWRALAAGAREGLTPEFLSEIQARGEMAAAPWPVLLVDQRFIGGSERYPGAPAREESWAHRAKRRGQASHLP